MEQKDLDLIEKRLKEVKLPPSIQLCQGQTITNVENFFKSHISVLRSRQHPRIQKLFVERITKASKIVKEYNKKLKK